MNQRKRADLISLLPSLKEASKPEVKKILQTVIGCRTSAHGDVCRFVLVVAKTMVRLAWPTLHPKECASLWVVWDGLLRDQWNEESKADVTLHKFWRKYKGIAAAYMGDMYNDMDLLLAQSGGTFMDHFGVLMRVTKRKGSFGHTAFGWATPKALEEHMQAFIKSVLHYPFGRLMNLDDYDALIEKICSEGDKHNADKVFLFSRAIMRAGVI